MSRVKALGIAEKKIQRKIPVERTQSEEVYLASPSFQKDFLILCSLFLTYTKTYAWTTSNVCNIVDENQILTSTSGITCVHVSSEKKEFFRLDNEKREIPIWVWKCNVHNFQPTKIVCSKLFKLKAYGDPTGQDSPVSHNCKSEKLQEESERKQNQRVRYWIPKRALKVYELRICR